MMEVEFNFELGDLVQNQIGEVGIIMMLAVDQGGTQAALKMKGQSSWSWIYEAQLEPIGKEQDNGT